MKNLKQIVCLVVLIISNRCLALDSLPLGELSQPEIACELVHFITTDFGNTKRELTLRPPASVRSFVQKGDPAQGIADALCIIDPRTDVWQTPTTCLSLETKNVKAFDEKAIYISSSSMNILEE